jgi:four helix bundle protein
MHNYKNLKVWQISMELAEELYRLSAELPSDERFGLISQMRRCVVSIASNIAEGTGRGSDKDFARFMNIALGSAFELETQVLLSIRLGYLNQSQQEVLNKVSQVQKMLHSLIKKFQDKT